MITFIAASAVFIATVITQQWVYMLVALAIMAVSEANAMKATQNSQMIEMSKKADNK